MKITKLNITFIKNSDIFFTLEYKTKWFKLNRKINLIFVQDKEVNYIIKESDGSDFNCDKHHVILLLERELIKRKSK